MKSFLCSVTLFTLALGAFAQSQPAAKPAHKHNPASPSVEEQIRELRQELQAEREANQQLQQREDAMQKQLDALQQSASQTQADSAGAKTSAAQSASSVQAVQGDVNQVKTAQAATQAQVEQQAQEQAQLKKNGESPETIHFKGVTLTPGGFFEANSIWRSHATGADLATAPGSIPFGGSNNSHLSEFRGSARHSRLSLLAQGDWNDKHLSGYYEMDFEGTPTNLSTQSNGSSLRLRQAWGQVRFHNNLTLTGGQMWSLLTTDRNGADPLHEFVPYSIDTGRVGYNWARQWGVRVSKDWNDKVWLAFAAENPSQSNSSVIAAAAPAFSIFPPNPGPSNLFVVSGLETNPAPDLLAKAVFEPGWGHYEIKAIGRIFRDRDLQYSSIFPLCITFPCPQPPPPTVLSNKNDYAAGGGLGFAAIMPATKRLKIVLEGMGGAGIGRYANGLGPDATLRPDGTVEPLRSFDGLGGLEYRTPSNHWLLYTYAGNEYYARAPYFKGPGAAPNFGYGGPVSVSGCTQEFQTFPGFLSFGGFCPAQNRDLWQVQPGFWYSFYKGPAGTLRFGANYSYTHRTAWSGIILPGQFQPVGVENTFMTSFRYYLPQAGK